MPFGKGRRKWFWALGSLCVGIAALWFSLPVWFPWLLRPLAVRAGARFSAYERLGYARFALRNLSFTNSSVIIHSRRVDALVPSVWLWELATGPNSTAAPFLQLDGWNCQLLPSTNTNPSPPFSEIQDLAATLRTLHRWVPTASLQNGNVSSGKTSVAVTKAVWVAGHLQASLQLPPQASGQLIEAALNPANPFQLQVFCPSFHLQSTLELSTNQAGMDISNSIMWETNHAELQAHFGRSDVLPQTATLRGTNLQFSGDIVKLPQYRELSWSLVAQWERGQFALDLTAAGRPAPGQTNFPPVDLDLHAQGDTNSAAIQKLLIKAPFIEANLSNPVRLNFSPPYVDGAANLSLTADLSRQQWVPLTGKLSGVASLRPGKGDIPEGQLQIAGTDIGTDSIKASNFELSAHISWPVLEANSIKLALKDGSAATLSAKLDLAAKSATDGRFRFEGPLVRRWLPAGYSYGKLLVSGSFHGPFDEVAHEGRIEVDQITSPLLQPLAMSARWNGEVGRLQDFVLRVASTNSSLVLEGALAAETNHAELRLKSLSLATNGASVLDLAEPATITLDPGSRVVVTPLRWSGPGGELALQGVVQWPDLGSVQLSIQRLVPGLFGGFTKTALPQIEIGRMEASAGWTNGPAILGLDLSATGLIGAPQSEHQTLASQDTSPKPAANSAQPPNALATAAPLLSTPLKLELSLRGDSRGILLSNLVVNSPTSEVVVARGTLPVTLNPAAPTNMVRFDERQPLQLQAAVHPQAFFWEELAKLSGVRLEDPDLDFGISGTWDAPQGRLTFQAKSIQLHQAKLKPIKLQDLQLALSLDRERARLSQAQLLIQGQRLSITGELPLGESSWKELEKRKLPNLSRASARLQIRDAQLAAFEPLFPDLLAPQGQLNLDLRLQPGERLEGALTVRDARTRPLGNTAPFRDINVTLRFQDRLLSLENASADLSGATIDLTGRVDLRGTNWLETGLPPFALTLRGTNVPLAREPDYIIRSDLDLSLAKTNDAPPVVFGAAHLRDSFFLSDLSALVPSGVAKPSSRPPYFSIDTPLLADWRLAVVVDGVRWLKLRTSLFDGEASANLHLEGTLKDPIALGGLKIDSGLVRFPFGNLQVQQGLVTLSSQDPYHPQLQVRANSKQFGYDIRMEVTGPADNPVIQFTSNPSLSSEQILLMLTAGQLPQGTYTLSPQQRAQTMALFLGRDLLAKLGLGDQTQERLTIQSGEEISEQGRPTYHVEYRFTKRWYIVGEYDRFGDYNAGFKWRVYSK